MERILLFGRNGQLGQEAKNSLSTVGEVYSYDHHEVDFLNLSQISSVIKSINPSIIYNAVAYTNVDKAEEERSNAHKINAIAPGVIAEEAKKINAILIHFSTDYVFDGTTNIPYIESNPVNPINIYGQTKLAGENAVMAVGAMSFIFRTAWVYSIRKQSFVGKVLKWSRNLKTLRIVSDQIGSPTWARSLAEVSAKSISHALKQGNDWIEEKSGLYHLAGKGAVSRLDWAKKIIEFDPNRDEQKVKEIIPAASKEFPTLADRPLYTALNINKFRKTFDLELNEWENALKSALQST